MWEVYIKFLSKVGGWMFLVDFLGSCMWVVVEEGILIVGEWLLWEEMELRLGELVGEVWKLVKSVRLVELMLLDVIKGILCLFWISKGNIERCIVLFLNGKLFYENKIFIDECFWNLSYKVCNFCGYKDN